MVNSSCLCYFFQTRDPHSLGERQVPIRGRLGARPRSGRWAAGEWADFHLSLQPLPITHSRHHCLPSPPVGPSSDRKASPGLSSLILHYGELCNYFIICHYVIIVEIKSTINVLKSSPNHPPPPPKCVENCLP